jgi:AraC-like DNA-binding protein
VALLRGRAEIELATDKLSLPVQHVALMLPGRYEFFRFDAERMTDHSWCAISLSALPESIRSRLPAEPVAIPLSERTQQLLELGLDLPGSHHELHSMLMEAIGLAAVSNVLFELEDRSESVRIPDVLQRALLLMEKGHAHTITVASLARHVGISPPQLTKLFRAHFGQTPSRYLWEMRTRRGIDLLINTGLSIAEISVRVGFQSPFHFTRRVRELSGESPRQLRQRSWGSQESAPPDIALGPTKETKKPHMEEEVG